MHASNLTSIYDQWTRPSYEVRVRSTTPPAPPMFLWGSAGITTDIIFDKPPILHIRNDLFGEPIKFGTQTSSGTQTTIGTLQPGECASIPLKSVSGQGICGVFASCELESVVACVITQG
jgi:hypothetical protein